MALASQMPPQLTTGLMSHPRLPHVARGPCVSLPGVRGPQAQAAMKAEQDVKVSIWNSGAVNTSSVLTARRAGMCLCRAFPSLWTLNRCVQACRCASTDVNWPLLPLKQLQR